ncbi:MAG TPA: PaaI family thioesterase [Mycobacterium sp.]|nr:PaaI family thioesterase [Mycobacterium sp.]
MKRNEPCSRSHTCQPPLSWTKAGDLSGRELLNKILDGDVSEPPICGTLGFHLVEVGEGKAAFEGHPGEHLLNPMAPCTGVLSPTLLDSALGSAVATVLPRRRVYATMQLNDHLVRPVFADTLALKCEAVAVHVGRTSATAEARVIGATDGKLYAHATTTCAILTPSSASQDTDSSRSDSLREPRKDARP